jgi:hypothetical protein
VPTGCVAKNVPVRSVRNDASKQTVAPTDAKYIKIVTTGEKDMRIATGDPMSN